MGMRGWDTVMLIGVISGGLSLPAPSVWAQALDVENAAELTREVAEQVDRLVSELAARDPELAQEIERQSEVCLHDLSDGRLEHTEITRDIEGFREVQREVTSRMVERQIAEATTQGNTELAERMQAEFSSWQSRGGDMGDFMRMGHELMGGGPFEGGGMPEGGSAEARTQFDQAYQEAVARGDTEGAEMMRQGFEAFERGETFRPTPEMMERMHQEMEHFMSERPEMADYARAEWDRLAEVGREQGERYGTEAAEHGFERWAQESGRSPDEIARIRETMANMEQGGSIERGMELGAMERGFEQWAQESGRSSADEIAQMRETMANMEQGGSMERGTMEMEHVQAEFERYYEAPTREVATEVERYYEAPERESYVDQRLEQQQQHILERTAFEPHAGHLIDHDSNPMTPDMVHQHEIHYHTDSTRHDHTGGT